ncbi:MAG: hypothetical protein HOE48_07005 [Candidatus Latescibacteria bacterium]|jgi:hypothetical protein|nr:hypothetical protein [Candidatus Latescibacterota bacterium]
MFNAKIPKLSQTHIHLNNEICGASPDDLGPIGGGLNYTQTIEPNTSAIRNLNDLLDALTQAKSGDTLYIHPRAQIDCTERVFIEDLILEIPEGVTLASNRGQNGSPGGMVFSDTFQTKPLISPKGPNVRITGLRLRGPNAKPCLEHHTRSFAEGRGHDYYYKFPTSDGIITEHGHLQVDNCELAGWSRAAIFLRKGTGHHIHHNFIHHNQYNGLGYGVSHDVAESRITHNLFNYNRHSIAGTGRAGSEYEACHNIELGHSLSHCFDMHGGRDRKDNTTIAGSKLNVHHNTFYCPKTAVVIRGIPTKSAEIHHNWFHQSPTQLSIRTDGNTTITNNVYGHTNPQFLSQTVLPT